MQQQDPASKIKQKQNGWGHGSSGRALAWHAQGPEVDHQYHTNKQKRSINCKL
jgi:hypothetical protein